MSNQSGHDGKSSVIALALGALGVVYGDIGTSPLYALKEIFFGKEAMELTHESIMGVTSTVFWALTLIVTIKYIIFVLRADHQKEGGVFALYAILRHIKSKYKVVVLGMLVLAAGLLFGDGVITPAISVISAVEGLGVATPALTPFVVPVTILILSGLFAIQKNGTAKIGAIFGPVMLFWFAVLAWLGLMQIGGHWEILQIFNPIWVIRFVQLVPFHELLVILGFVMLVVTGGEAMYADMGHFGKQPIRLSWLAVAYPALVINYLGQGAYLLSGKEVVAGSIFFSMAPGWALYPLIILATLATIIASQALITGAYSLAAQAYSLYLLPYLPTKHTHYEHEGQIYISLVNVFLYVGCVVLVLMFRSSSNLASAYGLAVSGVMLVTTISVLMVAIHEWQWKIWVAALVFGPFAIIDSTFLIANSLKFVEGGYVPLMIGMTLLLVMSVWKWGQDYIRAELTRDSKLTMKQLLKIRDSATVFTPGTVVILTNRFIENKNDTLPYLNNLYLEKYELLPQHLVFLTVHIHHEPYMNKERLTVVPFDLEPKTGTIISVKLKFGFMEEPEIESYLSNLQKQYVTSVDKDKAKWVFHVVEPRVVTNGTRILWEKLRSRLFQFMYRLSLDEDEQLGLGRKYHLTAEVVPIKIK